LKTSFDKWLYVLKHLSEFQSKPIGLQEKVFEKLFKAVEIAKFTKEERMNYEESLKQYRDLNNVIAASFDEGEAKGKLEGKLEIALNLLNEKMPVSKVAKLTGLSEEEVKKLKTIRNK